MPYERPEWAKLAQDRYNKLVPTLGQVESGQLKYNENGGIGLENLPFPGAFRQAPDIGNVVTTPLPKIVTGSTSQKASSAALNRFGRVNYQDTGFDVAQGELGAAGTVLNIGKVTLENVGDFLQKADPSSVAGIIKATAVETWGAGKRMLGAIGVGTYMLVTDPLFRKYAGSRIGITDLTPDEQKEFDSIYAPALVEMLKGAGFTEEDMNTNSALFRRWISDLFTLETSAATLWTGGEALLTSVKGVPLAISSVREGFNKKVVSEIVEQSVKNGTKLTIDTAENVFKDTARKHMVGHYLKVVGEVLKPGTKILTAGLTLEGVNAVRKYIDPETAERIARDQRQFVDGLSTAEMLILDLGIGLALPLEIPGMLTLKNGIKTFDKALDFEIGTQAFYKFFGNEESLQVLNKLGEFSDLHSGIGADHALRATLINHTLTVMEENGISPKNVEHFAEVWRSWMNRVDDVEIQSYLRRLENEGTKTQLSWYSNKLGRSLTEAEALQHWFTTAMEGKFVGDIGDQLVTKFDEAVQLATSGTPKTAEKITRTVNQFEKVKEIVGRTIKVGDARAVRDSIEALTTQKARLLLELQEGVESLGYKILKSGDKLVVPKAITDVPEIRQGLDALSSISKKIDDVVSEGRSLGIAEDILKTPNNSKLLNLGDAYNKFFQNPTSASIMRNLRASYSEELMQAIDGVKAYARRYNADVAKVAGSQSKKIQDATETLKSGLVGKVLAPDATDDDLLRFVLSLPTDGEDALINIPKSAVKILTKDQREILKMNQAISNFDKQLESFVRSVPKKSDLTLVSKMVTDIREVEAQLPRGMFVPEVVASHFSRWGKGVTAIPLVDIPKEGAVRKVAEAVAKLQDTNGVTRAIADYLVPHNPADIYVQAMNRLETTIETLSPGQKENVLKELAQIQDKGISLLPILPGGGPQWEALGKPMVTGLQWSDLDKVGAKYGINGFGKLVHESFIESMTVSGIKPGIVDRLRAAPGVGAIFDSIYKQYMLSRFALNPIFHAQQVPETALLGVLRSFNLPAEMSADYIKAVTKLPIAELDAGELKLFNRLKGDLVSKVAKKGSAVADATQETLIGADLLKSTGLEERKRIRAFIAEFPVRLRGELFNMPALNNVDPLMSEEFSSRILKLMNNPGAIDDVIGQAFEHADEFDPWHEAVLRSIRSTNQEVQKLTSYNLNRSALEKDLHALIFPFSFGKKTWSEIAGFATSGSVARPVIVGEFMTQLSDLQENPTMMEIRARYPTWVGWIYNMSFVNPQFPLVDLQTGGAWFGGLRGSPAQAVLWDTLTEGKYDIRENPGGAVRKLGGGGAKFWFPDGYNKSEFGNAMMELFRQDSDEQQRRSTYFLRQMKLEKQLKEELVDEKK